MPTQSKIGWRPYVNPSITPSSLWNSIYSVYNADAVGSSSLNTSLFAAYNGESNTNDSFGTNNGTAVGGLTYTAGKIGNAFSFNGTTAYVQLGDVMDIGTSSWSYSYWFNSPNAAPNQMVFSKALAGGSIGRVWSSVENNRVSFNFQADSSNIITTQMAASNIANNTWYHVVLVLDRTDKLKMYINGALYPITVFTGTNNLTPYTSTNYNTTHPFRIGSYTASDNTTPIVFFNGKIDAFNAWNKELTQSEITELYNSGNGAQYITDNFYKPTTNDALLVNNGTAQGGLTYEVGKVGTAFQFNGTNAYVALPNNSLNFTGNFSYSFWIKSTNTSSFTAIISNIENARSPFGFSHGYWYRLNSGKIQASYRDGNNSTEFLTTSVGSVSNGSWNHVVITFNKTNSTTGVKIYINGNIDTTGIPPNTGGTALPIGYSSPMKACIGALYFNGAQSNFLPNGTSIDALSAWNKELTASEITEIYNSGNGKQYPN